VVGQVLEEGPIQQPVENKHRHPWKCQPYIPGLLSMLYNISRRNRLKSCRMVPYNMRESEFESETNEHGYENTRLGLHRKASRSRNDADLHAGEFSQKNTMTMWNVRRVGEPHKNIRPKLYLPPASQRHKSKLSHHQLSQCCLPYCYQHLKHFFKTQCLLIIIYFSFTERKTLKQF